MADTLLAKNWLQRSFERFGYSRLGTWLILNVANRVDPTVMRWTGGRLSIANLIGVRLLLLTTTGAKSGLQRITPLVYFKDDARIILIASNGGQPHHPGWYHNLCAHPQATIYTQGKTLHCTARQAEGAERERLWQLAVAQYAGYAVYQVRTGERQIPLMILTPEPG